MERNSAGDLKRRLATAEGRAAAAEAALREREAHARFEEIDGRDQRYKLLFETVDDGFAVVECSLDANDYVVDWVWLEVNSAFETLSALGNVVGKRASDVVPSFDDNAQSFTRAISTGDTIRTDGDYNPGIDRWFRAHFARVGDASSRVVAVRFEDITLHFPARHPYVRI